MSPFAPAPDRAPLVTLDDVLEDLEAGRSRSFRRADRLDELTSLHRPTLGGPAFLRSLAAARIAGRIHPRLARRALERLWFTPWVHSSARRPVADLPRDATSWRLRAGGRVLEGYTAGQGPVVVLVHGWASRGADLRHLAGDLVGAGWRVVVPDLPAHGATAGTRTDLFELGAALAAVLRHERPEAAVVHSMGFPALLLALEQGAVAPGTIVALAPGRRIAHALEGFARRARLAPALVDELRRGLEGRYGSDVWDVLDVDRVLPDLASRGVVVHDADDDEVAVEDAEAIVSRWGGARLLATSGLGHRRVLRDATVRAEVVRALA